MKNIFPGLSIICGTALLIAGNAVAGIIFASLGFIGAIMGAALRHQAEQESIKAIKELTESVASNATGQEQVEQLGEAFGTLMNLLMSGFSDPTPRGGNRGGNNIH